MKLTAQQQEMVDYIADHPRATTAQIVRAFGLSHSSVYGRLCTLAYYRHLERELVTTSDGQALRWWVT